MRLVHKFSRDGVESMTVEEIKALRREIMFQKPNYIGHWLPSLQAELDSRRMEKFNRKALYISSVALVVSMASFILSWLK